MIVSSNTAASCKKDGKPLSAYSSEREAEAAAAHVSRVSGIDFVSYKCKKCEFWHISPRDRSTPSKECAYCIDSKENPKELYETVEAAENRAKIIEKKRGTKLNVYKCPYQDGYHLTHKNTMWIGGY